RLPPSRNAARKSANGLLTQRGARLGEPARAESASWTPEPRRSIEAEKRFMMDAPGCGVDTLALLPQGLGNTQFPSKSSITILRPAAEIAVIAKLRSFHATRPRRLIAGPDRPGRWA